MAYNKSQKLQDNIAAIKLVLQLSKESRTANDDERAVLRRYSGFGGLKFILNPAASDADKRYWKISDQQYFRPVRELYAIIHEYASDEKEERAIIDSVKRSVNTAFYTPGVVIDAIASVFKERGVEVRTMLDPSAGIGKFGDSFKQAYNGDIKVSAFEKDVLTGKILSALNPNDQVTVDGFETIPAKMQGSFDLATSNIPFGDIRVMDDEYRRSTNDAKRYSVSTIHNYFFLKALDQVREGGFVAFITSRGFMDSPSNNPIRQEIAKNARLVGAFRLPDGMFRDEAGTDVGSDLVVLQKVSGYDMSLDPETQAFCETSKGFKAMSGEDYTDITMNTFWWQSMMTPDVEVSVSTNMMRGTDPYGKPTLVFTHDGGMDGISKQLKEYFSRDLHREYIDYYQEHAPKIEEAVVEQQPTQNSVDVTLNTLSDVKEFMRTIGYNGGLSNVMSTPSGMKFVKFKADGVVTPNIYFGTTTKRDVLRQFYLYDNIMDVDIPTDVRADFDREALERKTIVDDLYASDREEIKGILTESGIPFFDVIDSERGSRIVFTENKNDNGNYIDWMDVSDPEQVRDDIDDIKASAEKYAVSTEKMLSQPLQQQTEEQTNDDAKALEVIQSNIRRIVNDLPSRLIDKFYGSIPYFALKDNFYLRSNRNYRQIFVEDNLGQSDPNHRQWMYHDQDLPLDLAKEMEKVIVELDKTLRQEMAAQQAAKKRESSKPQAQSAPVQLDLFAMWDELDAGNSPSQEEVQAQEAERAAQEAARREAERKRMEPRAWVGDYKEWYRDGTVVVEPNTHHVGVLTGNTFTPLANLTADQTGRLRQYVLIRDAYHELYNTEAELREEQPDLREVLNRHYDNFFLQYGRLNERRNARVIMMDALGRDGLTLENEGENRDFVKADIFERPVSFISYEITHVDNPEEALSASLNRYGRVNLEYMAGLTGHKQEEIPGLLKGQIYYMPDGSYEIASKALSGNVYEKLEYVSEALDMIKGQEPGDDIDASIIPALEETKAALQAVIPEQIAFDDIGLQFGERWIPTEYYEDYIGKLFNTKMEIHYAEHIDEYSLKAEDRWNLKIREEFCVRGEYKDYDGMALLAHAFHNTTPDIQKCVGYDENGDDLKGPDMEKIQLANTKIEEIRDGFTEYLTNLPKEKRDELQEMYNRKFNCFVKAKYDGSYQTFPGIDLKALASPKFNIKNIYKSQKDCVKMILENGGGICDHEVGTGKSLIMCMAAHEMHRLGIANKPMIIAMKANVAEIAATYQAAFPDDKILYASEKDFSPANRVQFFSRIKNNDYACVIMSHDQFGKIPQAMEVQEQILQDEIRDIDEALDVIRQQGGNISGRMLTGLEKRKENMEVKLMELQSDMANRKDDFVDFGRMGIDHIFIDESHQFKNLMFTTRHQRVSGLGNPSGSQKALNLLYAIRTIQNRTGKDLGATFLSGTTISNSLTELYLLFKYLRPEAMAKQGIHSFDAWAAVYAKKTSDYEFSVTNAVVQKERFRYFVKVPELATFYNEITDYRTGEDVGLDRPNMNVILHDIEPTADQKDFNERLVQFAQTGDGELIFRAPLNDREMKGKMLIATDASRKASMDMRLVSQELFGDDPNNKASHCARLVSEYYQKFNEQKGTQFIFSDLSTYKPNEWNIFQEIKDKLVNDYGIPPEEVRFIQEASSNKVKQKMIDLMNEGKIRVLFGSTSTLGTGVNAQQRAVAVHHIDIPWRPSDLEQRNGRARRTGNWVAKEFAGNNVDIIIYAVKRTLDSYKFNLLQNKQLFITQLKTNQLGTRVIDEGAMDEENGMNFAEYVAILSGNDDLLQKAKLEKKIMALESERKTYMQARRDTEWRLENAREKLGKNEVIINGMTEDYERYQSQVKQGEDGAPLPGLVLNNISEFTADGAYNIEEMGAALQDAGRTVGNKDRQMGTVYGFPLMVDTIYMYDEKLRKEVYAGNKFYVKGNYLYEHNNGKLAMSKDNRLGAVRYGVNALEKIPGVIAQYQERNEKLRADIAEYERIAGKPWGKEDELKGLKKEMEALDAKIRESLDETTKNMPKVEEKPYKFSKEGKWHKVVFPRDAYPFVSISEMREFADTGSWRNRGYVRCGNWDGDVMVSEPEVEGEFTLRQKAEEFIAKVEKTNNERKNNLDWLIVKAKENTKGDKVHQDNEVIFAARETLQKKGVDWQNAQEPAKGVVPTQEELETDRLLTLANTKDAHTLPLSDDLWHRARLMLDDRGIDWRTGLPINDVSKYVLKWRNAGDNQLSLYAQGVITRGRVFHPGDAAVLTAQELKQLDDAVGAAKSIFRNAEDRRDAYERLMVLVDYLGEQMMERGEQADVQQSESEALLSGAEFYQQYINEHFEGHSESAIIKLSNALVQITDEYTKMPDWYQRESILAQMRVQANRNLRVNGFGGAKDIVELMMNHVMPQDQQRDLAKMRVYSAGQYGGTVMGEELRTIAHQVKEYGTDSSVRAVVDKMIGIFNNVSDEDRKKMVLIPMPGASGYPGYMEKVVNELGERTGLQTANSLFSTEHEPLYDLKKNGTAYEQLPDIKFEMDGTLPAGTIVVLVDNVLDTGKTLSQASKTDFGEGVEVRAAVLAHTDNYQEYNPQIEVRTIPQLREELSVLRDQRKAEREAGYEAAIAALEVSQQGVDAAAVEEMKRLLTISWKSPFGGKDAKEQLNALGVDWKTGETIVANAADRVSFQYVPKNYVSTISDAEKSMMSQVASDLMTGNHLLGRRRPDGYRELMAEIGGAFAAVKTLSVTSRQRDLLVALSGQYHEGIAELASQSGVSEDVFTEALRRVDAERPAVVQDIAVQPYQIYHEGDTFVVDYHHGFGLADNLVQQVAGVHDGQTFERAGRTMVLFDNERSMRGFIDNIRTLNITYTNNLRDAMIERLRGAGIQVNDNFEDGQRILDEANDRVSKQIVDDNRKEDISFFRAGDKQAYGFVDRSTGTFYVDLNIARADWPLHEYTHLWAAVLRQQNQKEWANIVQMMKDTPVIWNYVKEQYPDLHTDDEIADECLAHFSGQRGFERLTKYVDGKNDPESILDKVAAFLGKFWKAVADLLHIHFTTKEDVADFILNDFLNEHNPLDYLHGEKLQDTMGLGFQFIGQKGATNLDVALDGGMYISNLRHAEKLEKIGRSPLDIKIETGWERGADGQWRLELPSFREFDAAANLEWLRRHPDTARYLELLRKDNAHHFGGFAPLTTEERAEYERLRELPDNKYWKPGVTMKNPDRLTLEDYVSSPLLFMAYPELRHVVMRVEEMEDRGAYATRKSVVDGSDIHYIRLNKDMVEEARGLNVSSRHQMKSTIAHEVQHYIQEQEGFARGNDIRRINGASDFELNVAAWDGFVQQEVGQKPTYDMIMSYLKDEQHSDWRKEFGPGYQYMMKDLIRMSENMDADTFMKNYEYVRDNGLKGEAWTQYWESMGEVESRNVQARMGMSMEQRRHTLAVDTEDVPRDRQTANYTSVIAASREVSERPVEPRKLTVQDREAGGALVDHLQSMGITVHTDNRENRRILKAAEKDQSEAGKVRHFKTETGESYGFAYKGEIHLDLRKLDAELPLHEFAHLFCQAMQRINPDNWNYVVGLLKQDAETWDAVKRIYPELATDSEVAEEVIAQYSGKRGAEKLQAELERMTPRDANYGSRWGNIYQNVAKAIQDFWKHIGDSMNIEYSSKEDIADQILNDFAKNVNPVKKMERWLEERDKEYAAAVERGDTDKARELFNAAMQEHVGNGVTPFIAVDGYRGKMDRLARAVKSDGLNSVNLNAINEAADLMAPMVPDNAVLVPAPSHEGYATDMLLLANAIGVRTNSEVADVLKSAPRDSQYDHKINTGKPFTAEELGIHMEGELPEGKFPVVIDNVVNTGNTAEACVQALGGGLVLSLASATSQERHVASLKSASPIVYDKQGQLIPLSERFELKNKWLGRVMNYKPLDGAVQQPVVKEPDVIQGLEGYSVEDVKSFVENSIDEILEDAGLSDDITIKNITVVGSRSRGEAHEGSDLDILVEYEGDFREDALFDILHEEALDLEGITIDINPINPHYSLTTEQWLARDAQWREEDRQKAAVKSDENENVQSKNIRSMQTSVIKSNLQVLADRLLPGTQSRVRFLKPQDPDRPSAVGGEIYRREDGIHVFRKNQDVPLSSIDDRNELTDLYRSLLEYSIAERIGNGNGMNFPDSPNIDGYEISVAAVVDGNLRVMGTRDGDQANNSSYITMEGLEELIGIIDKRVAEVENIRDFDAVALHESNYQAFALAASALKSKVSELNTLYDNIIAIGDMPPTVEHLEEWASEQMDLLRRGDADSVRVNELSNGKYRKFLSAVSAYLPEEDVKRLIDGIAAQRNTYSENHIIDQYDKVISHYQVHAPEGALADDVLSLLAAKDGVALMNWVRDSHNHDHSEPLQQLKAMLSTKTVYQADQITAAIQERDLQVDHRAQVERSLPKTPIEQSYAFVMGYYINNVSKMSEDEKALFKRLDSAHSVDAYQRWASDVRVGGVLQGLSDMPEAIRADVLALANQIIETKDDVLKDEVIDALDGIGSVNQFRKDALAQQYDALKAQYPDETILFRNGQGFSVYGADVNTIQDQTGWLGQTVGDKGQQFRWLNINHDGYNVLSDKELNLRVATPAISIRPLASQWKDEMGAALQTIDYSLSLGDEKPVLIDTDGSLVISDKDSDFKVKTLDFHSTGLTAISEEGKEMVIRDIPKNYYHPQGTLVVADYINGHRQTIEHSLEASRPVSAEIQAKQTQLLASYKDVKAAHENEAVLFRQKGFFEAFGQDADRVAEKFGVPVYERNIGGEDIHFVMIPTGKYASALEDGVDLDLFVAKAQVDENRRDIRSTISLNEQIAVEHGRAKLGVSVTPIDNEGRYQIEVFNPDTKLAYGEPMELSKEDAEKFRSLEGMEHLSERSDLVMALADKYFNKELEMNDARSQVTKVYENMGMSYTPLMLLQTIDFKPNQTAEMEHYNAVSVDPPYIMLYETMDDAEKSMSPRMLTDLPLDLQKSVLDQLKGGMFNEMQQEVAEHFDQSKEQHIDIEGTQFYDKSLYQTQEELPYHISYGDDPTGVIEGDVHVQFTKELAYVSFEDFKHYAEDLGGSVRMMNNERWADFFRQDDAEKFANTIVDVNVSRMEAVREGDKEKVIRDIPKNHPQGTLVIADYINGHRDVIEAALEEALPLDVDVDTEEYEDVFDYYTELKKQHPDELLVLSQKDFVEAFGHDASRMSVIYGVPLCDRVFDGVSVQFAMMSSIDFMAIDDRAVNIHVAQAAVKDMCYRIMSSLRTVDGEAIHQQADENQIVSAEVNLFDGEYGVKVRTADGRKFGPLPLSEVEQQEYRRLHESGSMKERGDFVTSVAERYFSKEIEEHHEQFWELYGDRIAYEHGHLVISGDLDLSDYRDESLPENLEIMGTLDARHSSLVSLPEGLIVHKSMDISGTDIKELPVQAYVGGDLYLNDLVMDIPEGMTVEGEVHSDPQREEEELHSEIVNIREIITEAGLINSPLTPRLPVVVDMSEGRQEDKKVFAHARVTDDDIFVYETRDEAYDDRNGISIWELPADKQKVVIDVIREEYEKEVPQETIDELKADGVTDFSTENLEKLLHFEAQDNDVPTNDVNFDELPYHISYGDDPTGVIEGDVHVQFTKELAYVSFEDFKHYAEDLGGSVRMMNNERWADFFRQDDAEKFANTVVDVNVSRMEAARAGAKDQVKSEIMNLLPNSGIDFVMNRGSELVIPFGDNKEAHISDVFCKDDIQLTGFVVDNTNMEKSTVRSFDELSAPVQLALFNEIKKTLSQIEVKKDDVLAEVTEKISQTENKEYSPDDVAILKEAAIAHIEKYNSDYYQAKGVDIKGMIEGSEVTDRHSLSAAVASVVFDIHSEAIGRESGILERLLPNDMSRADETFMQSRDASAAAEAILDLRQNNLKDALDTKVAEVNATLKEYNRLSQAADPNFMFSKHVEGYALEQQSENKFALSDSVERKFVTSWMGARELLAHLASLLQKMFEKFPELKPSHEDKVEESAEEHVDAEEQAHAEKSDGEKKTSKWDNLDYTKYVLPEGADVTHMRWKFIKPKEGEQYGKYHIMCDFKGKHYEREMYGNDIKAFFEKDETGQRTNRVTLDQLVAKYFGKQFAESMSIGSVQEAEHVLAEQKDAKDQAVADKENQAAQREAAEEKKAAEEAAKKKAEEEKKAEKKEKVPTLILQSSLLVGALLAAKENGGVWLNKDGKAAPVLHQSGTPTVSAFNGLMMALHSDAHGYKSNDYTTFNAAKSDGYHVKGGESGLPFNWYKWDKYVNRFNANEVIDKAAYDALAPEEKELYKVQRIKEERSIFNIDQTTMPEVKKDDYKFILDSQDKDSVYRGAEESASVVVNNPMLNQYLDLKSKHPDALLLFRTGDFYEAYKEDAEKASKILGITLTKSTKTMDEQGQPLVMAGFPHHALDVYLPKLIRAGQRVAICDQLDAPNRQQRGAADAIYRKAVALEDALVKLSGDSHKVMKEPFFLHSEYNSKDDTLRFADNHRFPLGKEVSTALSRVNDSFFAAAAYTGAESRLNRVAYSTMLPGDAEKYDRLVSELAAGVLMSRAGLPATLSKESMALVPYWERELKESPKLMDSVERDVNNAVEVLEKIKAGETVDYSAIRGEKAFDAVRPKLYTIANELASIPDATEKHVVIVKDQQNKSAAVILPAGASLEVNNEITGLNKNRFLIALRKQGFENVQFYNAGGALGLNQSNEFFADKTVEVAKLKQYDLHVVENIDLSEEIERSLKVALKQVQVTFDDNMHPVLYVKPVDGESFTVYPEPSDVKLFFDNVHSPEFDTIRENLGQKYYGLVSRHPDLKTDVLMPKVSSDIDLSRISKVNIAKDRYNPDSKIIFATIDGQQQKPIELSQIEAQRYWLVDDKNLYKLLVAAQKFEEQLHVDNGQSEGGQGQFHDSHEGSGVDSSSPSAEASAEEDKQERKGGIRM